ncbi:MAG: glycosyltransferase [Phycisphaerae bacterium]
MEPVGRVGVVVIGRNEGARLVACLRSIRAGSPPGTPVVYVDSNSTDDSVEAAKQEGAEVVQLDLAIPFTAARARNAGAQRLLERHPDVTTLQFADGDTALHARWIAHAMEYLQHHPAVAVVCGRLRERYPEASVYNLLADMEWDTAIGPAEEFGGISMIRVEAFRKMGGYRPEFIAGEEPDLAARLRLAGYRIMRLNHEMALHDLAMTRFSQWWRRTVRSGHALAQLGQTYRGEPLRFYRRPWRSTLFWGSAVPLGILLIALLFTWWALLLLPLAYGYLLARVMQYRLRRGDDRDSAFVYALFTTIGKFPQLLGMIRYYRNRWSKRQSTIIEYKAPVADHKAPVADHKAPASPNPVTAPVGNT